MSIAAISSYGSSAWNVQTRATASVGETQQSIQTASIALSVPEGAEQEIDEYLPSQAAVGETAATYKPPSQDGTSAVGSFAEPEVSLSLGNGTEKTTEAEEGNAISLQAAENSSDAETLAAPAPPAAPVAAESTEDSSSTDTIGKPSWISDENWAAIQETPNQQPSGMSDEDWQAYLEWAGKSSSSTETQQSVQQQPVQQAVSSEQAAVTEDMPPSAATTTVTMEQAESTTRETTTQSAQESGNRFNEYANRYSRWNSGNMNVGTDNRINITT